MTLTYAGRMVFDWVVTISILVVVSLRVWVHTPLRRKSRAVLLGDLSIVFSLILLLVTVPSMSWKNVVMQSDPERIYSVEFLTWGTVHGLFYIIGVWHARLTFIPLYYSLCRHMSKTTTVLVGVVGVYNILAYLCNVLLTFLWCHPFDSNWSPPGSNPKKPYCSPNFFFAPAAIQVFSGMLGDIMLLSLGLLIVSQLQLSGRQKVAVLFMVVIGIIPLIASSVRFSNIYRIIRDRTLTNMDLRILELWDIADWVATMHAACLPSLRALFRQATGRDGTAPSTGRGQASGGPSMPSYKMFSQRQRLPDGISSASETASLKTPKKAYQFEIDDSRELLTDAASIRQTA